MSSTLQSANVGETRGPTYLWLLSSKMHSHGSARERERERGSTWLLRDAAGAKVHSARRVKIIKGLLMTRHLD
jgi:hypothetical protein